MTIELPEGNFFEFDDFPMFVINGETMEVDRVMASVYRGATRNGDGTVTTYLGPAMSNPHYLQTFYESREALEQAIIGCGI